MDVILGGSIAAGIIYSVANYQPKEIRKINNVFRNVGYRAGKLLPRLNEVRKQERLVEYVYEVPNGLIDDPKLSEILSKTLRKPVSVLFRGVLIIRVYNSGLPTKVIYDWKPSKGWEMPIGNTLNGKLIHDFDKVPHMTIAGSTRQGKTVLLKLIIAHLINSQPENVEFYIIDLKGGLEFGKYRRLAQVKAVADSVKSAESVLQSIIKRLRNDMSRYAKNGYTNVFEANEKRRIFVITDEGAELSDAKYCREAIAEICRLGGALGYRNIFCTQYPTADTLPRQVKQNSDARVSFRLPTEIASRVALDEGGAEKLDGAGRAIYRTHERFEMQVPYVKDSDILEKLSKYMEEDVEDDEKVETENRSSGTNIIDISGFNLCD